jgi:dolichol-phosphate mannosyltransferase
MFEKDYSGVTVVIPTLNEAATIGDLLERLLGMYPGIRIVVADDVSTDGTQGIVQEVLRRSGGAREPAPIFLLERIQVRERGLTASVLDGISRVDTDFFAVMDGDLQHPPEVLARLFEQLERGADMAVAARLPYRENQGWHRILMTRVSKLLARLVLRTRGLRLSDPLSGLFAGRTVLVKEALRTHPDRFEPRGYKVLFDLLRVVETKIKLCQVTYQFGLRPGGHSKLRPAHAFYFLRSMFR